MWACLEKCSSKFEDGNKALEFFCFAFLGVKFFTSWLGLWEDHVLGALVIVEKAWWCFEPSGYSMSHCVSSNSSQKYLHLGPKKCSFCLGSWKNPCACPHAIQICELSVTCTVAPLTIFLYSLTPPHWMPLQRNFCHNKVFTVPHWPLTLATYKSSCTKITLLNKAPFSPPFPFFLCTVWLQRNLCDEKMWISS